MGQVLHGSARTTEAVRRAIALTSREREGAGQALRRQPHHGAEMAQARHHGRRADGAQGSSLDCAHSRGGSDYRRLPPPHAPAARRLPLRAPALHPAPNSLGPASVPAKARDQPPARDRGRQARQEALRFRPDRATSTSTSPRCRPARASCGCSWPSTAEAKLAFARLVESAGKMEAADLP